MIGTWSVRRRVGVKGVRLAHRGILCASGLALLAACSDVDLDLRDLGNGFDTSDAALTATADRPQPDSRGVISYPEYQVAVARRGDRVGDVANRVGLPAAELARFNGAPVDAVLNRGEILALPRRVAEPSPATGAVGTGPIQPAGEVDVTTLAGDAIDRAEGESSTTIRRDASSSSRPQTGEQPIRHKVSAGETAFSIARRYGVPVSALQEWNGLDNEYTVRLGQYLLIPPAAPGARSAASNEAATAPGEGTPTPTPPSAAEPLPEDSPSTASAGASAAAESVPDSPNLDEDRTSASDTGAVFALPVNASIVADYAEGSREGISFSATPGADVRAAGAGRVRYVSEDTVDGDSGEARVVLIAHDGDLNTVYVNVRNLDVREGSRVSRGESIGEIGDADPQVFQFQVRDGNVAVDPNDYIQ